MTAFLIPAGEGETELVEKRSRFLGHVWPVSDEASAKAYIEETKKRHRDARHNCWCYRINGGAERYSDDGEPQGTAGAPMLAVFQKAGVTNVVCVVTRYFGGVLLGAGGLLRAYTQAARDALDAAGVGQVRPWAKVTLPCPYPLLEQVKHLAQRCGGEVTDIQYGGDAEMTLLFPVGQAEVFAQGVRDLTAGALEPADGGVLYRAGP